jgi:hypothetical protein
VRDIRPLALLAGIVVFSAGGVWAWSWTVQRAWIVNQAVDRGACAATRHVALAPPTPPGSREIFAADPVCRAQIVRLLETAPNFSCRRSDALTVCEHPLNADDDGSYVRAVTSRTHVLLEVIPT